MNYLNNEAWKGYQQVESDPIKSTIKLYRRLILHLKKVKETYTNFKFKEGETSYEKSVLILTELILQLTDPSKVKGLSEEEMQALVEQVEAMHETYYYSLAEMEFIGMTKNVRNIDKVIAAITKLLEAYTEILEIENKKKQG